MVSRRLLCALALCVVSLTDVAEARAQSDASLPPRSDAAAAHAELGSALFELAAGRPMAATRRLETLRATPAGRAAAADPALDAELRFVLASSWYRVGLSSRFRAIAEPLLLVASPQRASVLRGQLALDAYRRGDNASVLAWVNANDADPMGRLARGLANIHLERYADARADFSGLRATGGVYAPYGRYLWAVALSAGEPARTMEAVDSLRALSSVEREELAHAALLAAARLAYGAGRPELAAEIAAGIPAASAMSAQAFLIRGWSHYQRRELDRAATVFGELAERHGDMPEGIEARVMTAQVLLESGRSGAAATSFASAAEAFGIRASGVQALDESRALAAAREIVASRTSGVLFSSVGGDVAGIAIPAGEAANPWLLLGRPASAAPDELPLVVSSPLRERWIAGLLPRLGVGFPARVLRQTRSARVTESEHATAAAALREADAELASAQYAAREAEIRHAVRTQQLARLEELIGTEADGLTRVEHDLRGTNDSLVRVLGAMGSSRDRARRYIRDQVAAVRELSAENAGVADSVRGSVAGFTNAIEAEIIAVERATAVEFATLANLVAAGLENAIARHPVFAQHDSVSARLGRNRLLLNQARAQLAATLRITRDELEHLRAIEGAELAQSRAALSAAAQRHADAESRLVDLVRSELMGRAATALAQLRRDAEVAEYGAASALFFAAVQEDGAGSVGFAGPRAHAAGGGAP